MIQGILATLLIVWAAFFLIKEARKKISTRDKGCGNCGS